VTGSEYGELKEPLVVTGERDLDATPGRDVDVIGEQGVPVPKGSDEQAGSDAKINPDN